MNDPTPTLNPQILGQAENAHRALLNRILAGAGLSYHQWVTLKVIAVSGPTINQLVERVTGALKIDNAAVLETVAELSAAKLLKSVPGDESRLGLTEAGRELHHRVSTAVDQTVARLYRDIPADDLTTAGRVLTVLTARIDADLDDA